MSSSKVLSLSENFETMTFQECEAFIARSRRQLSRLEHLPKAEGPIDAEEIDSILKAIDELEQSIRSHPNCPPIA